MLRQREPRIVLRHDNDRRLGRLDPELGDLRDGFVGDELDDVENALGVIEALQLHRGGEGHEEAAVAGGLLARAPHDVGRPGGEEVDLEGEVLLLGRHRAGRELEVDVAEPAHPLELAQEGADVAFECFPRPAGG